MSIQDYHEVADDTNRLNSAAIEAHRGYELPQIIEGKTEMVGGIRVTSLQVADGYEHESARRFIVASQMEMLQASVRAQNFMGRTALLRPRRDPIPGTDQTEFVPQNWASKQLYRSPETRAWASLMPSALALHNPYFPEAETLPTGEMVTDEMHDIFKHMLDPRAIRTRGRKLESRALELASQVEGDEFVWASLGGGAFIPAANTVEGMSLHLPDVHPIINVFDMDRTAMAFGYQDVTRRGLHQHGTFNAFEVNLRDDFLSREGSQVVQILQEMGGADLVEAEGLVEYFKKHMAIRIIQNGMASLKSTGGRFEFSNMLADRPQAELNQYGLGWHKLQMRSIEEVAELLTEAGIDLANVHAYVDQLGVYAHYEITKPPEVRQETSVGDVISITSRRSMGSVAADMAV